MKKADFVRLAKYASENWRGFFSDTEIKKTALIYFEEYTASQETGYKSPILKGIVEQLKEDLENMTENDPDRVQVEKWIECLA